jgi:hypothetical protein
MIRAATANDVEAIVGLAVKTKMFAEEGAPFLDANLREHFDAGEGSEKNLIVETSATARYDHTREFYARLGYEEEARVRDYWEDGDDLVIFRKVLSGGPVRDTQR